MSDITPDQNPDQPTEPDTLATPDLESDPLGGDPSSTGEAAGQAGQGETLGGTHPDPSNPASKDPSQWVTGDEPITAPQKSYLDTLARQAGEELSADMTKAEASEQIDRLQHETGRGE